MAQAATRRGWWLELGATFALAWPLIVAQLAQISLNTTDIVMMGWLGPDYLAAGTLANGLFFPLFIGGLGVIGATAPLIAQAIGAREFKSVRRTVRQGFWVSIVVCIAITPIVWQAGSIYRFMGQDEGTIRLALSFLQFAVWLILPALMLNVLRALLSARGDTPVILWITVAGFFVNLGLNYLLVFGNFGFPRLELMGSGISTTLVSIFMLMAAVWFVTTNRRYKRYMLFVRFWKSDWHRFREIFRVGLPIGLTMVAEVGLFGGSSMLMGMLGKHELAAHAVALQCASIAFMVPLGLGQATTVRVGIATGARNRLGIGLSGWTALGLTLMFMSLTSIMFLMFPEQLVGLFLNLSDEGARAALALAATYLGVAALFQLADGTQVAMASALRGMNDTRMPMVVALLGYWAVGFPIAWYCGFELGMRGSGIWLGLASGLSFVAVVLMVRFALRERLGLLARAGFALTEPMPVRQR